MPASTGLLVHAEHYGIVWRIHVKRHDLQQLLSKLGIDKAWALEWIEIILAFIICSDRSGNQIGGHRLLSVLDLNDEVPTADRSRSGFLYLAPQILILTETNARQNCNV